MTYNLKKFAKNILVRDSFFFGLRDQVAMENLIFSTTETKLNVNVADENTDHSFIGLM